MKLNKRLECVLSLVEEECSVIDIGCDHALLSIAIVLEKNPKKVIASDNKEGPLVSAKENIDKYKVSDKIKLKLGYGVEPIEEDIDTIIISGMGGLNTVGILKYENDKYKNVNTLILSPNTDSDFVRYEICKLGFYIEEEKLVKDNNFIYPVIRFKRGKKHYKKIEYILGPILLKRKDELFIEYLKRIKEFKVSVYEWLPKKYFLRKIKIKKELREINKIL